MVHFVSQTTKMLLTSSGYKSVTNDQKKSRENCGFMERKAATNAIYTVWFII